MSSECETEGTRLLHCGVESAESVKLGVRSLEEPALHMLPMPLVLGTVGMVVGPGRTGGGAVSVLFCFDLCGVEGEG